MKRSKVNFINVRSELDWDQYFMLQAMLASFKSKDPSTKVGAVFVDKNHHQISMGYNGFIAGFNESQLPWGNDQNVPLEDQKYAYVVHAESNAILHSSQCLEGTSAYITLFPCHECAKLLASIKVKEIIYLNESSKNLDSQKIAVNIFKMAAIKSRSVKINHKLLDRMTHYLKELSNSTSTQI